MVRRLNESEFSTDENIKLNEVSRVLKDFDVIFRVVGRYAITVEAESEDAAVEKAWDMVGEEGIDCGDLYNTDYDMVNLMPSK